MKKLYSNQELLQNVKEHKHAVTNVRSWDRYARKHHLPSSSTLIKNFGSWNKVKKELHLKTDDKRESRYSKNTILAILKRHKDHFTNQEQWNVYAKDNGLPSYTTIKRYVDYDEITEIRGRYGNQKYSEKHLIKVARAHIKHFTTMQKWDNYAKDNGLPSSHTYIRKFNGWRNAKQRVQWLE